MVFNPVEASFRTSSSLVSTGMEVFSFCKPSLGPTSTILTLSAVRRADVANARLLRTRAKRVRLCGPTTNVMFQVSSRGFFWLANSR